MRSQVTLRTAFTVCFAVVATAAVVLFVFETRLALTLTVAATMVAIALDHVVRRMEARGIRRGWAIGLTTLAVVLLITGLMSDRRSRRPSGSSGSSSPRRPASSSPCGTRRASRP